MDRPKKNAFEGMSTLRAAEKAKQPPSEKAKALQDYLKKYTDGEDKGQAPQKKRKKKSAVSSQRTFTIIDGDTTGFKSLNRKTAKAAPAAEELSGDEDDPVIANPEEAELYKRLAEKERSGAAMQNWSAAGGTEEEPTGFRSRQKRQRHDSPDASPPRRQRHDSPDASPRRRQRHDSPDASPPRRQRHDSPDASPPRRQRHDSPDTSPPRSQRHDSPDASPPRRGREDSSDASPPRRPKQGQDVPSQQQPARKPGRIAAGMVTGAALEAQLEAKKAAERSRFEQLEATTGSRHAETVYRDKETGRKMTKDEFEAAQKDAAAKKKATYETPGWGGGLRQIQQREQNVEAMQREAARPFARTLDHVDEDLNLRDVARFGDPMAHLVKKKAAANPAPVISAQLAKQMRKSGFVVPQDVPNHSWLKRNLGPPPNRYGIKPGRHWDGVDRSTGFERDLFKQQAARVAMEREARMWAQADM